jgi:hypothetical protein
MLLALGARALSTPIVVSGLPRRKPRRRPDQFPESGKTVPGSRASILSGWTAPGLGLVRPGFEELLGKKYNKSLAEWKEDVVWPRLLLEKLCRDRVSVSEQDLWDAYEADFGEKVQCWILFWPRDEKTKATEAAETLRKNANEFERLARAQPNTTRTLGRHRKATGTEELERAAFRLQPDEVSPLIETPDGFALFKCLRRIPADSSRTFEQVRDDLKREVRDRLVQEEIVRAFARLKKEARPRLLWSPERE